MTQLIQQRLTPGDIAIDVGAWGGHETRVMAQCVGPMGHVYALEPQAADGNALPEEAQKFAWVTVLPVAAAATTGTRVLYRGKRGRSSFYPALVLPADVLGVTATPIVPLDDVTDRPVQLVKIDAQGAEADVLAGATRLLAQCPHWILEFWPAGLVEAGSNALALLATLTWAGLQPRWADGTVMTTPDVAEWTARCTERSFFNITADRI